MLWIGILFFSCSKDDGNTVFPDPVQEKPGAQLPILEEIVPLIGQMDTEVTITGNNFGTDLNKVKVRFNNREAMVQTVTDTRITSVVPQKAKTGLVKIHIGEVELTGPEFEYQFTPVVSTLCGSLAGDVIGAIGEARFDEPSCIATDKFGNIIVADTDNHKIKKITPDGVVSTLAGTKKGLLDGNTSIAQFDSPIGVAVDSLGNVYVADHGNHRIRKITPFGVVITLAGSTAGYTDGRGLEAQFNFPWGIALDGEGNLYVSDLRNNRIRQVNPEGVVTTIAGGELGFENGPGESARFNFPMGLVVDENNSIYVTDFRNNKIRKISGLGNVSTFAGSTVGHADGAGIDARFSGPSDITLGPQGNFYVTDSGNHKVRKISQDGLVTTLVGAEQGYEDGIGTGALFNSPTGIEFLDQEILIIADANNNRIRKVSQE